MFQEDQLKANPKATTVNDATGRTGGGRQREASMRCLCYGVNLHTFVVVSIVICRVISGLNQGRVVLGIALSARYHATCAFARLSGLNPFAPHDGNTAQKCNTPGPI